MKVSATWNPPCSTRARATRHRAMGAVPSSSASACSLELCSGSAKVESAISSVVNDRLAATNATAGVSGNRNAAKTNARNDCVNTVVVSVLPGWPVRRLSPKKSSNSHAPRRVQTGPLPPSDGRVVAGVGSAVAGGFAMAVAETIERRFCGHELLMNGALAGWRTIPDRRQ